MDNQVVTTRTRMNKAILGLLARMPYFYLAQVAVSLPRFGLWRKDNVSAASMASSRKGLHEAIAHEVEKENILYLEFGVYQGDSIRYWTKLNQQPGSRFVGFDTFTGLPEVWQRNWTVVKKNEFDTGGAVPDIRDTRASFQRGLFQQTLRPFLKSVDRTQFDRLIVHMDADLYSATLYALCECDEAIHANDFIIFDEFSNVFNEFKALEDWSRAYGRSYKVEWYTQWEDQVAIRLT